MIVHEIICIVRLNFHLEYDIVLVQILGFDFFLFVLIYLFSSLEKVKSYVKNLNRTPFSTSGVRVRTAKINYFLSPEHPRKNIPRKGHPSDVKSWVSTVPDSLKYF